MFFGFRYDSISVRTDDLDHSFMEVAAMARLARAEVFDPSEVALLHICARVVRRGFLLGVDPFTEGKERTCTAIEYSRTLSDA